MAIWFGLQMRAELIGVVYAKILRVADLQSESGKILNIIQNDCERFFQAASMGPFLLTSPLFVIIAIILGYFVIGPAIFIGFAIVLIEVPMQYYITIGISEQRKKAIKITDQRINLMGEILRAAQLIKMYAWENSFSNKVSKVRMQEMRELRKTAYLKAFNISITQSFPIVCTFATLTFHTLTLGHELQASEAFAVLALFNVCNVPLSILSGAVRFCTESLIGLRRIEEFLMKKEFAPQSKPQRLEADPGHPLVEIKKCKYYRSTEVAIVANENNGHVKEVAVLDIKDFVVEPGSLVMIVGRVGSGKSTLLTGAILGNTRMESEKGGTSIVRGKVGYVSQQPWVFNGTVKENILMGKDYDAARFAKVINVCCLAPDLEIFPGREETELGERGINISGGQKTRVSLARAVYSDADLFIFDDVLSAVDSNVSKKLFFDCIKEYLLVQGKTVVLATHSLGYLREADKIVVMGDLKIISQGSYRELQQSKLKKVQEALNEGIEPKAKIELPVEKSEEIYVEPELEKSISFEKFTPASRKNTTENIDAGKLIQAESNEKGAVSLGALKVLTLESGGVCLLFCVCLFFWAAEGLKAGSDAWLTFWSDTSSDASLTLGDAGFAGVYGLLVFSSIFFITARGMLFAYYFLKAATKLHNSAFSSIIKARMSYFYVTQLGVIINRFSSDMDKVDVILVDLAEVSASLLVRVAVSVILIVAVIPYFGIAVVPMILLYGFLLKYFRKVLRQVKRLDSMGKTPLVNHCQSTLQGITTIKAAGQEQRYLEKCFQHIDLTTRTGITFWFSNRWIGIRLDFVTTWIIFFSSLLCVLFASSLSGGLAGLVITSALQTAGVFQYGTRQAAELEANLTSVERLRHFIETTPHEKETCGTKTETNLQTWPSKGSVEFVNFSVAYREGLPFVLNSISLSIQGGEKAALTGRTGSGKSSCLLSLFRIIEASMGSIMIDGLDISNVPLSVLRSKCLSIVPQEAVLFRGSIRCNLDPFDDHTDEEIWDALQRVHLSDTSRKLALDSKAEGLDFDIEEGGSNVSKGQRQLFCFARALLKNTQIICIDEGTSNVDETSDELIQKTLKESFPESTLIVIAHRLKTVRDMDKIFVLERGKVAEVGTPDELITKPGGLFAEMWETQLGTKHQVKERTELMPS